MVTDSYIEPLFDEDGVQVFRANAADFRMLNADMRDADMEECRVFGMNGDDGRYWSVAVSFICDGEFIGIFGFNCFAEGSLLAKERMMLFLTTNAVWRHKKKFVKYTPKMAKWALNNLLPPWVDTIYSFPMASYKGSIEWQERVIGFRRVGSVYFNGVEHAKMMMRKGE